MAPEVLTAQERFDMILDPGTMTELNADLIGGDPLSFPGYLDKLGDQRMKTGMREAAVTVVGDIERMSAVVCVLSSAFFMGSMGVAVGEKLTLAIEYARDHHLPLIIFSASGGARMQEGILSLMQMAKTSGAVKRHSDAGLLYITVLTDPTTGGVTASFAMEGDIILAEPNTLVAFAGPRVIEQTMRQKLPRDFQTSEFVMQKGFIDAVVSRDKLKETVARLLKMHGYKEAAQ